MDPSKKWKQYEDWTTYYISDHGDVYSCFLKDIYKPFVGREGVLQIGFTKRKIRKTIYIHRMVAKLFLPNPNGFYNIRHKDGNKMNNHVDNLEWIKK